MSMNMVVIEFMCSKIGQPEYDREKERDRLSVSSCCYASLSFSFFFSRLINRRCFFIYITKNFWQSEVGRIKRNI